MIQIFEPASRTFKRHRKKSLIKTHNLVIVTAVHIMIMKKSSKFEYIILCTFLDIPFFFQKISENLKPLKNIFLKEL